MIKNIIFDFGGVLYDIDFRLSFTAFENLGVKNIQELFSQHTATALFQQIEMGLITPAAFYNGLREYTPQPVTDEELKNAWNALLLHYRYESLACLPRLKEHYNLYLLSNTNIIHYNHFTDDLKRTTAYPSLESFFDKAYFSHEIHLRKPTKEAFEYVLEDAGLHAEETLFIDDTSSNLPAARESGIKTHLLLPAERIETLDFAMGK